MSDHLWYPIFMRKSKEQRLEDVRKAITLWEAAGMGSTHQVEFMRSSLHTLMMGKGLTTTPRAWLDTLCESGPPAPKGNPDQLARLDSAMAHLDPSDATILSEFRQKLVMGWSMSEKQTAFMERLVSKGEKVAHEGKWQPSPQMRAEGLFAAQVIDGRNTTWKSNCPGIASCATRVLAGEADEWTYNRLIEGAGPAVREFRSPKFAEGEMVWLTTSWGEWSSVPAGTMGLITGRPEAYLGDIGYPVLAGDRVVVVNMKVLTRRNPKKLA